MCVAWQKQKEKKLFIFILVSLYLAQSTNWGGDTLQIEMEFGKVGF